MERGLLKEMSAGPRWYGKDVSVRSTGEPGKALRVIKALDAELASWSCTSRHEAEGGTIASKWKLLESAEHINSRQVS